MCELMAISIQAPASAGPTLRAFSSRGEENPDGWGLAWYPDQSLSIIKEPSKWASSRLASYLEGSADIQSRMILAHVRHKTMGGQPTHADTHPFGRELGGRAYCFAHNGTLDGMAWDLPLGRFRPLGDTDSERFFCHLLSEIDHRGGPLDTAFEWRWLHQTLADANRFGKLNVLFSDGHRLFVYHDANGWKGLNFREVQAHRGRLDDVQSDSFSTDASNQGYLVATYPLDSTDWQNFELGELIVFEAGEIRFSSHRDLRPGELASLGSRLI